jgi:hypothetical protein
MGTSYQMFIRAVSPMPECAAFASSRVGGTVFTTSLPEVSIGVSEELEARERRSSS